MRLKFKQQAYQTDAFWFKHLPLAIMLIFFLGTGSFAVNKPGLSFTLCAGTWGPEPWAK
jgi:hypothetical protein